MVKMGRDGRQSVLWETGESGAYLLGGERGDVQGRGFVQVHRKSQR
jgi:hypothetical protein